MPAVAVRVAPDPAGRTSQQRHRAVGVPAQQVDVAGAHLREPLEELRVAGPPGLLPGRLPGLVRREEAPPRVYSRPSPWFSSRLRRRSPRASSWFRRPRLRAAEQVARTLRLLPGLAGDAGLASRLLRHARLHATPRSLGLLLAGGDDLEHLAEERRSAGPPAPVASGPPGPGPRGGPRRRRACRVPSAARSWRVRRRGRGCAAGIPGTRGRRPPASCPAWSCGPARQIGQPRAVAAVHVRKTARCPARTSG